MVVDLTTECTEVFRVNTEGALRMMPCSYCMLLKQSKHETYVTYVVNKQLPHLPKQKNAPSIGAFCR